MSVIPKFSGNLVNQEFGTYVIVPFREDIQWDKAETIAGDEWLTKPHAKSIRPNNVGRLTIKPAVIVNYTMVPSGTLSRVIYSPWLLCGSHIVVDTPYVGAMCVFPSDCLDLKTEYLIVTRVYAHFKSYSV